jgi:hypothetical protein
MDVPDGLNGPLLERLAARAGVSPDADAAELLARLGEQDPKVALLASYLASRREQDAVPDISAEDDLDAVPPSVDDPGELEVRTQRVEGAFRRLRQRVQLLYAELEELRERNDQLAAALGACHLCWGEDPGCPLCGGDGGPGAAPPDRRLFVRLVVPATRVGQPRHDGDGHAVPEAGATLPAIDRP